MANWGNIKVRGNVSDRRGFAPKLGGISITGLALLMLLSYATGGNPLEILSTIEEVPLQNNTNLQQQFAGEDEYEIFASTVLGSNNEVWENIFQSQGKTYTEPTLVLFREATESGCGGAYSEIGPHYCPLDKTIYLDETFFEELTERFGASGGDVAEAYVIAHEVGHHVQNELDLLNRMNRTNEQSINIELQADCFAGIWAHFIKDLNVLNPGEIEEAMNAAAAVGDDRIQESITGNVNKETWTHGSSKQRVESFTRGYNEGKISACEL